MVQSTVSTVIANVELIPLPQSYQGGLVQPVGSKLQSTTAGLETHEGAAACRRITMSNTQIFVHQSKERPNRCAVDSFLGFQQCSTFQFLCFKKCNIFVRYHAYTYMHGSLCKTKG